jgi:hypothetical protein
MCARNAHRASNKQVARELWKMAEEYRAKAADLDNGMLPDIGDPPPRLED